MPRLAFRLSLLVFLCDAMIAEAASAPVVLVEDGQARAAIVVPRQATPAVQKAAEELASYLKKISGAELPIVSEPEVPPTARIDVGPTEHARKHLPEFSPADEERVVVRSVPCGVIVCGGGDRGTRYAVYRFLESLGCRWLAPEPENELVPRVRTIDAGRLEVDARPAFAWRLFAARSKPEAEQWGLKMGFNGLFAPETASTNGGCFYWPREVQGVHAFVQIMPPEKYFEAHPEWYPLLNGKRVASQTTTGQLCVTAPGLADAFSANVIRLFDADPAARLVSISPNDGYGWCECPDCTELDRKLCGARTTKQGLASEKPFQGDRLFWFANQVAERVGRKHPDRKLLVLAYVNYAEPPDTIRPAPGVVPFVCHYAPADYSRPVADPTSEANRQFNDLVQRWIAVSPEVMIYSYVSKSMWWRLPRPVLEPFAADVKHYYHLGIRRYYCQSTLSDWPLDGPLYYVIARLLWDPDADPQAAAQEWIDGMFGPAARPMSDFYQAVADSVRATGRSYSDNPRTQVPGLYDRAGLDRAMAALEQAEKLDCPQNVRERIEKVAATFRYGYWMIEALEHEERVQNTGDPAALLAAQAAGRKALGFCQVPEAVKHASQWSMFSDLGVPAQGFGEPETKGGRRCWNSDETGPGDNRAGWASFTVTVPDPAKTVVVEMEVWGESQLSGLVINTRAGEWNSIRPERPLSKKPQWDTLIFRIPPELMNPERRGQRLGFGGADSQVWVAAIRVKNERNETPLLPRR
ncbi:MAG TPA: DUF4838 domain-containing protein [Candidatus Anammoximicrobium sp.]|nr:DUF4838 domain-containing protein [Candidatus Anammoximicrobium sp.]